MLFKIKETGETKELEIYNNGIEWTKDLLGNNGALMFDNEIEEYIMSEEDFSWWEEYINQYNSDEEEMEEVIEMYDITMDELKERINEALEGINDLEDEHNVKQNVFNEIKFEAEL